MDSLEYQHIKEIESLFLVKRFHEVVKLCSAHLIRLAQSYELDYLIPHIKGNENGELLEPRTHALADYATLFDFFQASKLYIILLLQSVHALGQDTGDVISIIEKIYKNEKNMIPFDVLFVVTNILIKNPVALESATPWITLALAKPIRSEDHLDSSMYNNDQKAEYISMEEYINALQLYIFFVLTPQKEYDKACEVINDDLHIDAAMKERFLDQINLYRVEDGQEDDNVSYTPTPFVDSENLVKETIEKVQEVSVVEEKPGPIPKSHGWAWLKEKWFEIQKQYLEYYHSLSDNEKKIYYGVILLMLVTTYTLFTKWRTLKQLVPLGKIKDALSRWAHEFKVMALSDVSFT